MKQEKLIGEDLNRLSKIVDMTDEDYQGSGPKDTLLEKDNLFGNDLGVFLATPTDNIDGNRKCYKR